MTPYVGELRFWPLTWAPLGWMLCHGQILSISENETLYWLIGTTFGGDGQDTFALPDLRGRTPIGVGTNSLGTSYVLGESGGQEEVALGLSQIPSHGVPTSTEPRKLSHPTASSAMAIGGSYAPTGSQPAAGMPGSGGSQPHENMPPYLVLNWIISLYGIFPQRD